MKTSRKKMLLSSIAMLLVALVALGSATYAWFTADPTADAKGLNMKTESGLGLLVLSDTHNTAKANDWSHHTILNASTTLDNGNVVASTTAKVLKPVSLAESADSTATSQTFLTTQALADNAYGQDSSKEIKAAAATDYYSEEIACKVTGGAASATLKLKGIKWTPGSNDEKNAVRVAIVGTDSKVKAIYAVDSNANGYLANTTYAASNPTYTPSAKADSVDVTLGTALASGTSKVKVIVYLDGEDTDCFSNNVDASSILNNLELYFEVE